MTESLSSTNDLKKLQHHSNSCNLPIETAAIFADNSASLLLDTLNVGDGAINESDDTISNIEPVIGVTLFSESLIPIDPKNCDAETAAKLEKKRLRNERRKEDRQLTRKQKKEAKSKNNNAILTSDSSTNVNCNALTVPDCNVKSKSDNVIGKKSKDQGKKEQYRLNGKDNLNDICEVKGELEPLKKEDLGQSTNKQERLVEAANVSDTCALNSSIQLGDSNFSNLQQSYPPEKSNEQKNQVSRKKVDKDHPLPSESRKNNKMEKGDKIEKKVKNVNNNKPVGKLGDLVLSPEFEKKLEPNRIHVLKKKPIRFPKARFFCRLCDYHLDTVEDVEQHMKDNRHCRRKEISNVDSILTKLPIPGDKQVEAVTAAVKKVSDEQGLTSSARDERQLIVTRLQDIIRMKIPDAMMFMYGSSLTCFGLKDADININLNSSNKNTKLTHLLKEVYLVLKDRSDIGFSDIRSEFSAKVPAVKLTDDESKCTLTITIHCYAAQCSSQLLSIYSDFDQRVRQLAQAFRYWARLCGLDKQAEGFIPPQALNLMVIYFLQHMDPQLVPIIQPPKIQNLRAVSGEEVGDFTKDAPAFSKMRSKVMKIRNGAMEMSHPEVSIGELWLRLLKFYTLEFDTASDIVSIRSNEGVTRAQKPWNSKKLGVEDPYMEKKNVTRMVNNTRIWEYWQDSIRKASYYFGLPRDNQGRSFLSSRDLDDINLFKTNPDAYRDMKTGAGEKELEEKKGFTKKDKKAEKIQKWPEKQGPQKRCKSAEESSRSYVTDTCTTPNAVSSNLVDVPEVPTHSKHLVNELKKREDKDSISSSETSAEDGTCEMADTGCKMLSDRAAESGVDSVISNILDTVNEIVGVKNLAGSMASLSLQTKSESDDSKTELDTNKTQLPNVCEAKECQTEDASKSNLKDDNEFKVLELLGSDNDELSSSSSCDNNSVDSKHVEKLQGDASDDSNSDVFSDGFWNRKANLPADELMVEVAKLDCSYKFSEKTLTNGKGPSLVCTYCEKMGHLKNSCPEDELPEVLPLPTMSKHHLEILSQTLWKVPDEVGLSPQSLRERKIFLQGLEEYIRGVYQDAQLRLFGSSCNGFGFDKSDMDICMTFAHKRDATKLDKLAIIETLYRELRRHHQLTSVQAIPTAKVPIVKFTVRMNNLEGDISLYNTLAQENTRLLHCYSQIDPRVRVLGYTIKTFAKVCDIGDASRGSLSSYSYILMMLYYLQQVQPPVLPVLQELYIGERPTYSVENCDAWFMDDLSKLSKLWPEGGKNKLSVAELWLGFLRFYVEEFNYREFVVCIRQKELLTRFEKLWNGTCIAIEDPFDLAHNLGSGLNRKMNNFIFKTFINGRMLYGSPVDDKVTLDIFRSYKCPSDYFFDTELLAENRPLNARGCRKCGKIGHLQRQCPIQIKEWEEEKKQRQGRKQLAQHQQERQRYHQQQQQQQHHNNNTHRQPKQQQQQYRPQPNFDHGNQQYRQDQGRRNGGAAGSPKQSGQYSLRDNPRVQPVVPGQLYGQGHNYHQQYNRGQNSQFMGPQGYYQQQQQQMPRRSLPNQSPRSPMHTSQRGASQSYNSSLMGNSPRSSGSGYSPVTPPQRMYYNSNVNSTGNMGDLRHTSNPSAGYQRGGGMNPVVQNLFANAQVHQQKDPNPAGKSKHRN